jgi:hypothetical protein
LTPFTEHQSNSTELPIRYAPDPRINTFLRHDGATSS